MMKRTKIPKCGKTFNELYELWQNAKQTIPPVTAQGFIAGLHKFTIAQLFQDIIGEMAVKYLVSEGVDITDNSSYKILNERKGGDVLDSFTDFLCDFNSFDEKLAQYTKEEMAEHLGYMQMEMEQMIFYSFLERLGINVKAIFTDAWMDVLNLNHPNSQRNMLIAIASDSPSFEIEDAIEIVADKEGKFEEFYKSVTSSEKSE